MPTIDRDDEHATRYEMTDKPTIDEQIKYQREPWGSGEHEAAIAASLEELKRIREAEMPVEPEILSYCADKIKIDRLGVISISNNSTREVLEYIDSLKAVIQRKADEAREQRKATEHWAICHNRQMERAESLAQEKAALVAENEGLRKDAERYRWLRCGEEGIEFRDGDGIWRADGLHSDALDSAIDKAMKGGGE